MKVLIIGNGGREHAIGWKIRQDNPEVELYFNNGNGGTAQIGTNLSLKTVEDLADFAEKEQIDLTFVGPEDWLMKGVVDTFQERKLSVFGPNKKAALLEGSKEFAKNFMLKYGVKTAKYKTFNNYTEANEYAKNQTYPLVVKADGLAAGKGVVICYDKFEAEKALDEMLNNKIFGEAGNHVVIEEFLEGFETSILSVFNGKDIYPFISAKDHKKIGEGETGLNTGGMGVVAPNPYFTEELEEAFRKDILEPTLKGLLAENLTFAGIIFFGLMITNTGVYLLEYNMRMGDPETQATLPLMQNNFLDVLHNALTGNEITLNWKNQHTVCVVLASGGYPLNYETDFPIKGLDQVTCPYFVAGAYLKDEQLYTSGGRVLNIVGIGDTQEKAREQAYDNITKIHFDYNYCRKDIGEL
ncbi:phosphoribosylamine--glycine ligase [Apibacter sp. HY039]|uniref:phosphoribosylamine--glycine ligase n=1 Tax=Apibacter sp. HY039 TaxID=2501476 RepID=UPI000FEC01B7|nr:phosphoribosylamine--glycine ligase [Apibacter sp. HY039]